MARLEGTDPEGAGINEQKVNKEGQALVFAVNQSEIEHESEANSQAYSWSTDLVDAAAVNATILLLKNTSDVHLHIDSIYISTGSTPSEFTVHLPTTEVTVGGGATVTGVNLNTAGVPNVADASAQSNETGNSQGDVIETVFLAVDRFILIPTPGLVLGKNKSVGVDSVADVSEASVTIRGHYAD